MMLPASTRSPPNFLTPRYCGLLVRPFLLEPTPFLCAMTASADLHVGNLHFGELLAVAGLPAVVLAALELEDVDLLFLAVAHDLADDGCALHERRAGANGVAVRRKQHLVEGHLLARFLVHEREPERLPLFGPELLAERPEDCVHVVNPS